MDHTLSDIVKQRFPFLSDQVQDELVQYCKENEFNPSTFRSLLKDVITQRRHWLSCKPHIQKVCQILQLSKPASTINNDVSLLENTAGEQSVRTNELIKKSNDFPSMFPYMRTDVQSRLKNYCISEKIDSADFFPLVKSSLEIVLKRSPDEGGRHVKHIVDILQCRKPKYPSSKGLSCRKENDQQPPAAAIIQPSMMPDQQKAIFPKQVTDGQRRASSRRSFSSSEEDDKQYQLAFCRKRSFRHKRYERGSPPSRSSEFAVPVLESRSRGLRRLLGMFEGNSHNLYGNADTDYYHMPRPEGPFVERLSRRSKQLNYGDYTSSLKSTVKQKNKVKTGESQYGSGNLETSKVTKKDVSDPATKVSCEDMTVPVGRKMQQMDAQSQCAFEKVTPGSDLVGFNRTAASVNESKGKFETWNSSNVGEEPEPADMVTVTASKKEAATQTLDNCGDNADAQVQDVESEAHIIEVTTQTDTNVAPASEGDPLKEGQAPEHRNPAEGKNPDTLNKDIKDFASTFIIPDKTVDVRTEKGVASNSEKLDSNEQDGIGNDSNIEPIDMDLTLTPNKGHDKELAKAEMNEYKQVGSIEQSDNMEHGDSQCVQEDVLLTLDEDNDEEDKNDEGNKSEDDNAYDQRVKSDSAAENEHLNCAKKGMAVVLENSEDGVSGNLVSGNTEVLEHINEERIGGSGEDFEQEKLGNLEPGDVPVLNSETQDDSGNILELQLDALVKSEHLTESESDHPEHVQRDESATMESTQHIKCGNLVTKDATNEEKDEQDSDSDKSDGEKLSGAAKPQIKMGATVVNQLRSGVDGNLSSFKPSNDEGEMPGNYPSIAEPECGIDKEAVAQNLIPTLPEPTSGDQFPIENTKPVAEIAYGDASIQNDADLSQANAGTSYDSTLDRNNSTQDVKSGAKSVRPSQAVPVSVHPNPAGMVGNEGNGSVAEIRRDAVGRNSSAGESSLKVEDDPDSQQNQPAASTAGMDEGYETDGFEGKGTDDPSGGSNEALNPENQRALPSVDAENCNVSDPDEDNNGVLRVRNSENLQALSSEEAENLDVLKLDGDSSRVVHVRDDSVEIGARLGHHIKNVVSRELVVQDSNHFGANTQEVKSDKFAESSHLIACENKHSEQRKGTDETSGPNNGLNPENQQALLSEELENRDVPNPNIVNDAVQVEIGAGFGHYMKNVVSPELVIEDFNHSGANTQELKSDEMVESLHLIAGESENSDQGEKNEIVILSNMEDISGELDSDGNAVQNSTDEDVERGTVHASQNQFSSFESVEDLDVTGGKNNDQRVDNHNLDNDNRNIEAWVRVIPSTSEAVENPSVLSPYKQDGEVAQLKNGVTQDATEMEASFNSSDKNQVVQKSVIGDFNQPAQIPMLVESPQPIEGESGNSEHAKNDSAVLLDIKSKDLNNTESIDDSNPEELKPDFHLNKSDIETRSELQATESNVELGTNVQHETYEATGCKDNPDNLEKNSFLENGPIEQITVSKLEKDDNNLIQVRDNITQDATETSTALIAFDKNECLQNSSGINTKRLASDELEDYSSMMVTQDATEIEAVTALDKNECPQNCNIQNLNLSGINTQGLARLTSRESNYSACVGKDAATTLKKTEEIESGNLKSDDTEAQDGRPTSETGTLTSGENQVHENAVGDFKLGGGNEFEEHDDIQGVDCKLDENENDNGAAAHPSIPDTKIKPMILNIFMTGGPGGLEKAEEKLHEIGSKLVSNDVDIIAVPGIDTGQKEEEMKAEFRPRSDILNCEVSTMEDFNHSNKDHPLNDFISTLSLNNQGTVDEYLNTSAVNKVNENMELVDENLTATVDTKKEEYGSDLNDVEQINQSETADKNGAATDLQQQEPGTFGNGSNERSSLEHAKVLKSEVFSSAELAGNDNQIYIPKLSVQGTADLNPTADYETEDHKKQHIIGSFLNAGLVYQSEATKTDIEAATDASAELKSQGTGMKERDPDTGESFSSEDHFAPLADDALPSLGISITGNEDNDMLLMANDASELSETMEAEFGSCEPSGVISNNPTIPKFDIPESGTRVMELLNENPLVTHGMPGQSMGFKMDEERGNKMARNGKSGEINYILNGESHPRDQRGVVNDDRMVKNGNFQESVTMGLTLTIGEGGPENKVLETTGPGITTVLSSLSDDAYTGTEYKPGAPVPAKNTALLGDDFMKHANEAEIDTASSLSPVIVQRIDRGRRGPVTTGLAHCILQDGDVNPCDGMQDFQTSFKSLGKADSIVSNANNYLRVGTNIERNSPKSELFGQLGRTEHKRLNSTEIWPGKNTVETTKSDHTDAKADTYSSVAHEATILRLPPESSDVKFSMYSAVDNIHTFDAEDSSQLCVHNAGDNVSLYTRKRKDFSGTQPGAQRVNQEGEPRMLQGAESNQYSENNIVEEQLRGPNVTGARPKIKKLPAKNKPNDINVKPEDKSKKSRQKKVKRSRILPCAPLRNSHSIQQISRASAEPTPCYAPIWSIPNINENNNIPSFLNTYYGMKKKRDIAAYFGLYNGKPPSRQRLSTNGDFAISQDLLSSHSPDYMHGERVFDRSGVLQNPGSNLPLIPMVPPSPSSVNMDADPSDFDFGLSPSAPFDPDNESSQLSSSKDIPERSLQDETVINKQRNTAVIDAPDVTSTDGKNKTALSDSEILTCRNTDPPSPADATLGTNLTSSYKTSTVHRSSTSNQGTEGKESISNDHEIDADRQDMLSQTAAECARFFQCTDVEGPVFGSNHSLVTSLSTSGHRAVEPEEQLHYELLDPDEIPVEHVGVAANEENVEQPEVPIQCEDSGGGPPSTRDALDPSVCNVTIDSNGVQEVDLIQNAPLRCYFCKLWTRRTHLNDVGLHVCGDCKRLNRQNRADQRRAVTHTSENLQRPRKRYCHREQCQRVFINRSPTICQKCSAPFCSNRCHWHHIRAGCRARVFFEDNEIGVPDELLEEHED